MNARRTFLPGYLGLSAFNLNISSTSVPVLKTFNADGDDKIDLLINTQETSYIYQNTFDNTLLTFTGTSLSSNHYLSPAVADFNGDFSQDILMANATNTGFTIFKNSFPCNTYIDKQIDNPTYVPFVLNSNITFTGYYLGSKPSKVNGNMLQ